MRRRRADEAGDREEGVWTAPMATREARCETRWGRWRVRVDAKSIDRVIGATGKEARGRRHGVGVTRIRWGETTDDERDGFLCADLHGMSGRKCMLTGKKANNGRSISFSHIRNKTLQQVNLQVRRAAGDSSVHARWGGNPRT